MTEPQVEEPTRDDWDVDLSDKEDDSEKEAEENGEDIGASSGEDEGAQIDDDGDDNDDEGEDVAEGGAKKRRKKNSGEGEEERARPTRREVNADEIEFCFVPLAPVDKQPLCLVGVSFVVTRVVPDAMLFEQLRTQLRAEELEESDAKRRRFDNYDHYDDQLLPDAPQPLHLCQMSLLERAVCSLEPARLRPEIRKAMAACKFAAHRPQRSFVVCVAQFASEEQLRANHSPLLCYSLKGRLVGANMFTANWQSATEWPGHALDNFNAPENAALVAESVLRRGQLRDCRDSCTASHPLVANHLFKVAVTGRTQFRGDMRITEPALYKFALRSANWKNERQEAVRSLKALPLRSISTTLRYTAFLLPARALFTPNHQREQGACTTECEQLCAVDPIAKSLLTVEQAKKYRADAAAAIFRTSREKNRMLFDDAVAVAKDSLRSVQPDSLVNHKRVVELLLPALAPAAFWRLERHVGFDTAVALVINKVHRRFEELMRSPTPHLVLSDAALVTFGLVQNTHLINTLATRLGVTVDDIVAYNATCATARLALVGDGTARRCISRPELTEAQRRLFWPTAQEAPFGAFKFADPDDNATTFVVERQCAIVEAELVLALRHAFRERISLLRTDSVTVLDDMVESAVRYECDETANCLLFVATEAECIKWRERLAPLGDAVFVIRPEKAQMHEALAHKARTNKQFTLVLPRSDLFSHEELATTLCAFTLAGAAGVAMRLNKPASFAACAFDASNSDGRRHLDEWFSAGLCGRRLVVGGLAFQQKPGSQRPGAFLEDLYFSGVVPPHRINESYELIDRLRNERSNDNDDDDAEDGALIKFTDDREKVAAELVERKLMGVMLVPADPLLEIQSMFTQSFGTKALFSRFDARSLEPGRFVVIAVDSWGNDILLYKGRRKPTETLCYVYDTLSNSRTRKSTDHIVVLHLVDKQLANDGLSLQTLIAMFARQPAGVTVFGTRDKSIKQRVLAQQHAPWFLRPPTRTLLGRPWHQNSEATELSSLCWMLNEHCK